MTAPVGTFNPNDRTWLSEHKGTHGFDGGVSPRPKAHSHVPVHDSMQRVIGNGFESVSPTAIARAPDASVRCRLIQQSKAKI